MAGYHVLEEIAKINHRRESSLCLDMVRLNNGGIGYELRVIWYKPYGEPGNGITMTGNDLHALYEVLREYYRKPEKAERKGPLKNDTPL